MRDLLSDLWSSRDFDNGPPPPQVTFQGEQVWAIYEFDLSDGDRLRVDFEHVEDAKAAQGLELKVENGALFGDEQVHDELLKRIRLWSDTMPTSVVDHTVVAHRPGDRVFVTVWHVWRWHEEGRRADAWLGAYGFRVDEAAYESCVMAGGDPEDELNRALNAAADRGITV